MNIDDLLAFTDFTHKFQQVKRTIYATGEDRNENDAEHCFQLALLAWYINHTQGLKLNDEKLIKYALAHDLVETYAGDTFYHTTDQTLLDSKKQREHEAMLKIQETFKEFPELTQFIEAYEDNADAEARFVYALDKIVPVLNIYLDNGRSWQRDEITYDMVRKKDKKIAVSKDAELLWKQLTERLEQHSEYFHQS